MIGLLMFPTFANLGYVAYRLRSDLEPYSENVEKSNSIFLMSLVQKASFGVAIGFVLFGEHKSLTT
jgi:hypothetical protein